MGSKPRFTQDDFDNLEFVRQIVLHRLIHDRNWNQFDYQWVSSAEPYVEFEDRRLRERFVVLANEVMWQFVIQGIITPGMNASNPTLPHFRVTDYGQRVLEEERFLPHDPADYLRQLSSVARSTVGLSTLAYLEEALRCFNAGCHVAAVLLLGVAAESIFLGLCSVVESALKDTKDQRSFSKRRTIKSKHRWLVDKYLTLPSSVRRSELPESLDVTLISLYDLIRRQRNELGHPQETPPELDREQAFTFFRMFPGFVSDVEAFVEYCQAKGL